ncbi:MAG: hypothetical protein U0K95_02405 [Eubacterium sp.]|nr:hypothetical protein [Eubacterium sp.]
MKKTKQIAAIVALLCIAALIIGFIISAFTTTADSRNLFFAFFAAIIALPLLAWLFLLCYGKLKGKHTMVELFPNSRDDVPSIKPNPEHQAFTEEELTQAMESEKHNL